MTLAPGDDETVDDTKTSHKKRKTRSPFNDISSVENPSISNESWFVNRWRPAMAWLYMILVVFDFIVAPIFTGIGSAVFHISYVPWDPLTLKSAGLIHVTFGAILGLYTFGRTREKLNK